MRGRVGIEMKFVRVGGGWWMVDGQFARVALCMRASVLPNYPPRG